MANTRVTLIVGASGAAASRVLEATERDPGFTPIGLTRRDPGMGIPWITADLWDGPGLARAIAARPDITHIVYASRAPHGETGVEDVAGNVTMLRNLLDGVRRKGHRFVAFERGLYDAKGTADQKNDTADCAEDNGILS